MIDRYLAELRRLLPGEDQDTVAEVQDHLLSAAEACVKAGIVPEQAERLAVERFGDVRTVAASLAPGKEEVHLMKKRTVFTLFTRAAALAAYGAVLTGAAAADSFAQRMSSDVVPTLAMLVMLALLVTATRLRYAGRVGVTGLAMVAVTLASVGPVVDWDGTDLGAALGLAGPAIAFGALAVTLRKSGFVSTPILVSLGSPGIAAAAAIVGVAWGADLGALPAALLLPFGAAILCLGAQLWREGGTPAPARSD